MKILLPVEKSTCSEAAADVVIAQFPPETSEVRVLHAVEWPKELPPYLAFAEGPTAARDILEAHGNRLESARFFVDEVAHRLKAAGFATSTDVREGVAAASILEAAAEWHADMIVLGSHGRTGMERLLAGSVAEHVMRHAACAVEIVPAGALALRGPVTEAARG